MVIPRIKRALRSKTLKKKNGLKRLNKAQKSLNEVQKSRFNSKNKPEK
jgi:hypothetical protein